MTSADQNLNFENFSVAPRIARLIVDNTPPDRFFDYIIPEAMERNVVIGARVKVPFARREATGYVIELPAESPHMGKLKPITSVDMPSPIILPSLISLARWMAKYYLAPISKAIETLLPAPIRSGDVREKKLLFVDAVPSLPPDSKLTKRQLELYEDIKRVGGGWLRQITEEFKCSQQILKKLCELGALTIEERQQRRNPLRRGRVVPTQPLPLNDEQHTALAAIVAALPAMPSSEFGVRSSELSEISTSVNDGQKNNFKLQTPNSKLNNSSELEEHNRQKPIVLFGVTGSGKTEVYLQAIAAALDRGQGAIILVPEISLTPQTVHRFASRFGDKIAVLHSALSNGERYDEWQRIRKGVARVVVGPRSAVFAPVEKLGLIIVDEEHEPSYKQDETPRYNGRDAAVMRAHIERCAVVLGSATPSLETWNNALLGKYRICTLHSRAVEGAMMPLVRVIDMKEENSRTGRVNVFSQDLLSSIHDRLTKGEQIILFLNRRGYATSLSCPSCGYTEECDRCDIPYTYHRHDDCLRCHICGQWKRPPQACPACGDPQFKYGGFGTQRIEKIIRQCFPHAKVARMDADSTSRKESHDDILDAFKAGKTEILIGTQMIAKGLDFPRVTLVGIINADSSLQIPDFRAGERTFQLLAQVSGRTGRGVLPGEVVIQTYTPEHPAVQMAKSENFIGFAEDAMAERKGLCYPPYVHLTSLTVTGPAERIAEGLLIKLAREIFTISAGGMSISEVCPASLAKADNLYRFQLILRSPSSLFITTTLRKAIERVPIPPPFRLTIDVDAFSI